MEVSKRDGRREGYVPTKIIRACKKAGCSDDEAAAVEHLIGLRLKRGPQDVAVDALHDMVEGTLMATAPDAAKSYILFRQRRTDARAMRLRPDGSALSEYIDASKYCKWREDLGRREDWADAITRNREMHILRYPSMAAEIAEAYEEFVYPKIVTPSMRSVQFGGRAIEVNHARMYNCSFTLCDRPRFFCELFFLLLSGCGVGYSIQRHHVRRLPALQKPNRRRIEWFEVPDTVEGWAQSVDALVGSYVKGGHYLEFIYTGVRTEGTPLVTSGGKAPGHVPLKIALEALRAILDAAVGRQLRPIECHDICCFLALAVLSGGIRRSSLIALFSPDDVEMREAKSIKNYRHTPGKQKNTHRAMANNSAVFVRGKADKALFEEMFTGMKDFGEPGVFWTNHPDHGGNPCGEIGLDAVLRLMGQNPQTGIGFCVSGDTQLILKQGRTRIENCIGEEVEIWNGKTWKAVTPFKTGEGRNLYRVTLSDGSHLDCTENHKWLVKTRFGRAYQEVETMNLMYCKPLYAIHTPPPAVVMEGGIDEPSAYEYGYVLGDGTIHTRRGAGPNAPTADLYGVDTDLPLKAQLSREWHTQRGTFVRRVVFKGLERRFAASLKYDEGLPDEIFSWDRDSLKAFIAGWMDADGTQTEYGFRIYGREDKLRDLQMLLTKLGMYSSVNLMQRAGEETNLGIRKHAVWYVQVSSPKDLWSHRLEWKRRDDTPAKGKWQVVKSVKKLPGRHTTYCLEEPEQHTCLFGNVITKQCNLTELNAMKIKSVEHFYRAAKVAAMIGTLQAGYTDFPFLGSITEQIVRRDALLGVGITGIMNNPIVRNPAFQREAAQRINAENVRVASLIGINPAARTTTVKPAGTSTLSHGFDAPGHHTAEARRSFRLVTANPLEPAFLKFKEVNPHMCEEKENGDWVITFPVEVPSEALVKEDVHGVEFMDAVFSTYEHWVKPGTVDTAYSPGLTHNVSCTIPVKKDDWAAVCEHAWKNRECISAMAFSAYEIKNHPHLPRQAVKGDVAEARWNELIRDFKPVDYSDVGGETFVGSACEGLTCEI